MEYNLLSLYISSWVIVGVLAHYVSSPNSLNAIPNDEGETEFSDERVTVALYYESLCPFCIQAYPDLRYVALKLGDKVDIHTYPYGNAQMEKVNDKIVVRCQHGEKECYGNMLHACAIDLLKTVRTYINYVACLMENYSNDEAADYCGENLQVQSKLIKECAKSKKGYDLLIYYGLESKKVTYPGVPYFLVNGKELSEDETLWDAVCGAFHNTPKECQNTETEQNAVSALF